MGRSWCVSFPQAIFAPRTHARTGTHERTAPCTVSLCCIALHCFAFRPELRRSLLEGFQAELNQYRKQVMVGERTAARQQCCARARNADATRSASGRRRRNAVCCLFACCTLSACCSLHLAPARSHCAPAVCSAHARVRACVRACVSARACAARQCERRMRTQIDSSACDWVLFVPSHRT